MIKISTETLTILKNFSSINKGIVIRKGKPIQTISEMQNIYATAEIQETFPADFGIYELPEFLNTLNLFQKPVLDFGADEKSNFVIIREDGSKSSVKYRFSDIGNITTPTEEYEIPSVDIEFDLSHSDISKIQKACAVLGLEDIIIKSDGKTVSVVAKDSKNNLSNFYELELDIESKDVFELVIKTENILLVAGDYNVKASKSGSVLFTNPSAHVSYLIALEESSKYE